MTEPDKVLDLENHTLEIYQGPEFQQDIQQATQLLEFLDHDSQTVYQCFYPKHQEGATQQQFISSYRELIGPLRDHQLDGLNCVGLNDRPNQETTTDTIPQLDIILFDVDVPREVRDEHGVATESQIKDAYQTVQNLQDTMDDLGFSMDYLDFSGNGFHPGFKVDRSIPLNKDYKETELYHKLEKLERIASSCTVENVEIDAITKDFARRVKVPGTYNVKSYEDEDEEWQPVPEDKWRRAEILEVADEPDEEQNTDALEKLEVDTSTQNTTSSESLDEATPNGSRPSFSLETDEDERIKWLKDHYNKFEALIDGEADKLEDTSYASRSEEEMALCTICEQFGFDKDRVLDKSRIGKWGEAGDNYQQHTKEKVESYVSSYFDWEEWEQTEDEEEKAQLLQEFHRKIGPSNNPEPQVDREKIDNYVSKICSGDCTVSEEVHLKEKLWDELRYAKPQTRTSVFDKLPGRKREIESNFKRYMDEQRQKDAGDEEYVVPDTSMNKSEKANHFMEWLVNEKGRVRSVKQGTESNVKKIYWLDTETNVWRQGGEEKINELAYEHLGQEHSTAFVEELRNKVKAYKPLAQDRLGTEANHIAVQNGLLQVDTEELEDIEPKDYIDARLPVEYKPDLGKSQKFQDYLRDVVPEEDERKTLQEYAGYCLMDSEKAMRKYGKSLMLVGPTDSGKSVFLHVLKEMLGRPNTSSVSLTDLSSDTGYYREKIVGKLANINNELNTSNLTIDRDDVVKNYSEARPVSVRPIYGEPYDITPTTKHIFATNQTPKIDGDNDSFYNRWLTVKFPESIPKEEQNTDLEDELTTDEEKAKILNWVLEGHQRLREQGEFSLDESWVEIRRKWNRFGDTLDKFIERFLVTRRDRIRELESKGEEDQKTEVSLKSHTQDLYKLYQKYATGLGEEVVSQNVFVDRLKQQPDVSKPEDKVKIGMDERKGFRGVELSEDAHKRVEKRVQEYQEAVHG